MAVPQNAVYHTRTSGTGKLKKMLPGTKSVLSEVSGGKADVKFCDGDKLRFGSRSVRPSHMVRARVRCEMGGSFIRCSHALAAGVARVELLKTSTR